MDDSLNRAFTEAPRRGVDRPAGEVSRHPTAVVHDLTDELQSLRAQLLATIASPFFDDATEAELIPVIKHGHAQVGTVKVIARKRDPTYEAVASIEVRCDQDEPPAGALAGGRYEVRAKVAVSRGGASGRARCERVFAVHEVDGGLQVDSADLKARLADEIRELGKPL